MKRTPTNRPPTNPTRWSRVREVFEAAVEREGEERAHFLREATEDDPELLLEVERLIEADTGPVGRVDRASQRLGRGLEHLGAVVEVHSLLGRQVGAFTLERVLASGGMGTVFVATQERPGRRVALKVMRQGLGSPSALRRFQYEAEILGSLTHPGIAQVYEAGSLTEGEGKAAREVPWFAMEYIEGARTLLEYASDEGLSTLERVDLFARICDTVQHGHGRGIIHRDLKPGNLLVDRAGHPKVIDFGVARAVGGGTPSDTTLAGEIVGTLQYMSPEQMLGDPALIDTGCDVYALGVVLHELVCGRAPYDLAGRSLPEVVRLVSSEAPTAPQDLADIPRDLAWILSCAIERDRQRRYGSCAALAADLRRLATREPVEAGPPTRRYRLAKFIERNRAEVLLGTLVLFLAVGMPLFFAAGQARLSKSYARLADTLALEELRQAEDALWPARPAAVDGMRAWLARAGELLARLPEHERSLAELEALEDKAADTGTRWRRQVLEALVAALEGLGSRGGLLDGVRTGLEDAQTIEERSLREPAAAWRAAALRLAQDARFGPDSNLAPQLGLVPLGPDPDSGLEEFVHLPSGMPPRRDADGALVLDAESGVVLVLLPGGEFQMGADPTLDPDADPDEGPRHRVEVAAFFASKYELTQAQWLRATGETPSFFSGAMLAAFDLYESQEPGLMHPVEQVDWARATQVMRRLGLALPTERQWEYAARAGTTGPYWSGATRASLQGRVNISDASAFDLGQDWPALFEWPEYVDGYPFHAPVGALPPNAFGLHEVLGNVSEWCANPVYVYDLDPGDEWAQFAVAPDSRAHRGGSFYLGADEARVSKRGSFAQGSADLFLGLRPIRPLDEQPWP